ncbi:MAG TPA: hypothetical protein VL334_24315 [Anaerolineae bacterium]|nr:hypothetical protein [Anaerolineae bacterium]
MTRKKSDRSDLVDGLDEPEAPEAVLVRALMPLWNAWELVAPGTVYEQPASAAAEMAALGMVDLVSDGFDTAQTPTQPTEVTG